MTEADARPKLEDVGATELFEKALTSSDLNAQGRIIIPKAQAVAHLPPLDRDAVELICQDTCGEQHVLKFHSWINNQSRMYLLDGTQDIQALYGMRVGDSMVFGRLPGGELVVCGRARIGPPLQLRAPAPAPSESPFVPLNRSSRRRRGQLKPYDPSDQENRGYREHSFKEQDPLVPYFDPSLDGVFRACPHGLTDAPGGVALEHGVWAASVNLAGELYQAYFETEEAAREAHDVAACAF